MATRGRSSARSRAQPLFPSRRELIVIAKRDAGVRVTPEGLPVASEADVKRMSDILSAAQLDTRPLRPLFGVSEDRMQLRTKAVQDATGEELPNMSVHYEVVPATDTPDELLDELAGALNEQEAVEAAYVKPPSQPPISPDDISAIRDAAPPAIDVEAPAVTANFRSLQGYLEKAPDGIDAVYAWTLPGGGGAGVGIIDIEGAWNLAHEDLAQNQGGIVAGAQRPELIWRNHGTAVVGEFGGDRNEFGITGICPEARVRTVSFDMVGGSAAAIRQAADASSPGDIILIELHRAGPLHNFEVRDDQLGYIAMEWWPDEFAVIRYAISRGVIVVEAAGNGGEDLDADIYNDRPDAFPNVFPSDWTNPFNMSNPISGAIVVGAGAPPPGTHGRNHGEDRSRLAFSNYGARIDVQGWGKEVATTGGRFIFAGDIQGGGDENLWYTDQFSGTSSASPIVVGALGCVQGVLRGRGSTLLTPATARDRLRSTGSPQEDEPGRPKTQRIGNRPDLRELIPPPEGKIWHRGINLSRVYCTNAARNAWAEVHGLGWRKVRASSASGVTNMFSVLCDAAANDKKVDIYMDESTMDRVNVASE